MQQYPNFLRRLLPWRPWALGKEQGWVCRESACSFLKKESISTMNLTWKFITEIARELRRNPTPSEKLLWKYLRKRQIRGYKFLRQKPFVHEQLQNKRYFFIADFYCAELNLVIEVDGKIHDFQKEYDYQRDLVLRGLDLNVLRIKNEELVDMDSVLERILEFIPE
jgi:leucyl-tRNA synthetase